MGFRGEAFVFDSPGAAVAGMIARLAGTHARRAAQPCPLDTARGRILAKTARTDRDSPPFDHAAMDGYALRASDAHANNRLPVAAEARIGSAPPALPPHPSAARIATGAPIPNGADAVVKREDVVEHNHAGTVTAISLRSGTASAVRMGDHVRRRAENARAGTDIVPPGTTLHAAALAALAAVGIANPRVYHRLRVAIITTGDELVPTETTPDPYQTRNSNGPAIRAILESHPCFEVVRSVHTRDDESDADRALAEAIAVADAVILSGGVSMGHRDPVRHAVEQAGAEIIFHGLPQRPGKPVLGAIARRSASPSIPVFALPGNPVSAMVTCTRIVLPVLFASAGAARPARSTTVSLSNPDGNSLDLWWHRIVRIQPDRTAELIDARGSGDLIAAAGSDGFIELPPGSGAGPGSGPFAFYPWAG